MDYLKLQQLKGQIEGIIAKLEPYLEEEEFKDVCDNVYSVSSYIELVKFRVKKEEEDD